MTEKEAVLREALADIIAEMEDMIGYVPDYFRKKWKYDAAIAEAKKALNDPRYQ